MTRILKLQVADQVSTLNRITSAFVRLQYNIDTLHVTHSEQPGFLTWKFKSIFKMIHHFIF